jgi:p-hydroxybenzoate 3-monooxygenase
VQEFSWFMSSLLHVLPDEDGFGRRLRRSELDWLVTSEAASRSLAENYVGLPFA